MAVCLGSGRVDTTSGGCGWQSRHDREGSAGEARRRERDVEGVCVCGMLHGDRAGWEGDGGMCVAVTVSVRMCGDAVDAGRDQPAAGCVLSRRHGDREGAAVGVWSEH